MQVAVLRLEQMEREYGSLLRAVWKQRRDAASSSTPAAASSRDAANGVAADEEADRDESAGDPSGPDISGARYGLFVSLRGGMSELLDALESRVRAAATVEFNRAIHSITPLPNGGYHLTAEDKTSWTVDGVIVALPAFRAAALISGWNRELARSLDRIPYASSAIVVTGHRLDDISHPLDAFGLVIPQIERRRILAVSFLSRKFEGRSPEGTVQLRTFVGGAMQPEFLDQDDASLVKMVREELGVTGEPLFHRVARYERGMPQYHVGHLDVVAEIERRERSHPAFALAGNAYRGVGLPDSIHSGEQAAERVFNALTD